MGNTAISAHVELPWKGRTSDESFLGDVWGKQCLLHVTSLVAKKSYVGSTFAPMFQDDASTCFGSYGKALYRNDKEWH